MTVSTMGERVQRSEVRYALVVRPELSAINCVPYRTKRKCNVARNVEYESTRNDAV